MVTGFQQVNVNLPLGGATALSLYIALTNMGYYPYGTKKGSINDPYWASDLAKFLSSGATAIQAVFVDNNNEIVGWIVN